MAFRGEKKLGAISLDVSLSGTAANADSRSARQLASGRWWALVGMCMAINAVPAWGQCAEEQKLTALDAAANDLFGTSVSVDGDTVVVGVPEGTGGGTEPGSAYVYVRTAGVWTQQQKLTASDAAADDRFGSNVSVSGDTAVVGAEGDDGPGTNSGSAYVFVRSGTVWTQQQKLTASDAAAIDFFGGSVSVNGNTIVVGASSDDDACPGPGNGNCNSGSVYVYVRTAGVWTQQQKLTASDMAAGDLFGVSVSVSGDTVVVGAYADDDAGTSSGSAYVFVRTGGVWTQQQKLTASDASASDFFGVSVSVSDDTAVVGARQADSAYVFVRSGVVWTEQQILTASDAALADSFGDSVSVSADTVVVGARWDDDAGSASGSVYVFARSGTVWTQQQKLTASDAAANDEFGQSVEVSGSTVVIGARLNDDAGSSSGSAYVFECALFCFPQNCNNHGTCDNGTCVCNTGFAGAACNQCGPSYYNYPTCAFCQAATTCSGHGACNSLGGCNCNFGFAGAACNQCGANRYNYPTCTFCLSSTTCSGNGTCNSMGSCDCDPDFSGPACACGNGALDSGEECDDGNGVSGDGCSATCAVELDAPPVPTADPSDIDKTRFISFVVPAALERQQGSEEGQPVAGAPGSEGATAGVPLPTTALRVDLVSLHHVVPPYTGGASIPFTSFEGQVRWVGPPTQYVESSSNATTFYAAPLQCTPHYQDWSTVGLVHVYGSAVVPSSVYEVENVAASCMGNEANCTAVSARLSVNTTRWGDVAADYNPPSTTTQPDVNDIAALVSKFRSAANAPIKARALLAGDITFGNITTLNVDFGFDHIAACVDAFRGKPYPYTIQACP